MPYRGKNRRLTIQVDQQITQIMLSAFPKRFVLLIFIFIRISFSGVAQPNVVLIITDDQGYGDLAIHGNPHIQTPALDRLAAESVVFDQFYVTPVCATTRASLMTGRYSLRTGIRDTYNGGAMMAESEITLAELLKSVNYTTGMFGKWHLGDNYPFRPGDQGFDESVIHLSGGMGQVGDITTWFKGDKSYFDPVLWKNGKPMAYHGYCSDIFAEQAIHFIENNYKKPFFCYLSFNAPHTPLQVPEKYYDIYRNIDPAAGFEHDPRPFTPMNEKDKEDARKVYAMVHNIDENIGKLLDKLEELAISENTIVIFMTDNGPQQQRFNDGMRGLKASVYRGGVRVPLFIRYPAIFENSKPIRETVSVIDLFPTLAEVSGATIPEDRINDGISLLPLLKGEQTNLENRPLFLYWTRRYPELYNNMALMQGDFRLVGHTDYNAPIEGFELFNYTEDPYERNNLIEKESQIAMQMKMKMTEMYSDLILSENLINPPEIIIGSPLENPTILNRNDADGERGIWSQEEIFGKWQVNILEGTYNIRFKFIKPVPGNGKMTIETQSIVHQMINKVDNVDVIEMDDVKLPAIRGELIPFYTVGQKRIFPFWVELTRID